MNDNATREELIAMIRAALERSDVPYIMLHAAATLLSGGQNDE